MSGTGSGPGKMCIRDSQAGGGGGGIVAAAGNIPLGRVQLHIGEGVGLAIQMCIRDSFRV